MLLAGEVEVVKLHWSYQPNQTIGEREVVVVEVQLDRRCQLKLVLVGLEGVVVEQPNWCCRLGRRRWQEEVTSGLQVWSLLWLERT